MQKLKKNFYVTFQLVHTNDIHRPHLVVVLLRALRWDWLPLVLIPLFFTYMEVALSVGVPWPHLLWMIGCLICFHFFAFLFNDYSDYISGTSRVEGARINPVLKYGWMSAAQVYRLALLFFALGCLAGLPIFLTRPWALFPIVGSGLVGLVGYSFGKFGFKGLGLGEIVVYFCLGPLLVTGLAIAMTGDFHTKHLVLGLFWGWVAAICLSFRQFANLMYDDKVGIQTLVRRLGFDRAKGWLYAQMCLQSVGFIVLHLYLFPYVDFVWSCLVLFMTLGLGLYLFEKIGDVDSSLASGVQSLHWVSVPMSLVYGFMIMISVINTG